MDFCVIWTGDHYFFRNPLGMKFQVKSSIFVHDPQFGHSHPETGVVLSFWLKSAKPVGFAIGSETVVGGTSWGEDRSRGRLIRFGHVHMTSVKTMLIIGLRLVRFPTWRLEKWLFLAIGLYHTCLYPGHSKHMLSSRHRDWSAFSGLGVFLKLRSSQKPGGRVCPKSISVVMGIEMDGGFSNIWYFHPEPWGSMIWWEYASDGLVQTPTSTRYPNLGDHELSSFLHSPLISLKFLHKEVQPILVPEKSQNAPSETLQVKLYTAWMIIRGCSWGCNMLQNQTQESTNMFFFWNAPFLFMDIFSHNFWWFLCCQWNSSQCVGNTWIAFHQSFWSQQMRRNVEFPPHPMLFHEGSGPLPIFCSQKTAHFFR